MRSELKMRIKTGALLTVVAAAVTAASGIPFVMRATAFALSLAGEWELLNGAGARNARTLTVCGLYAAAVCFVPCGNYFIPAAIFLAGYGAAFAVMMKKTGTFRIRGVRGILPFIIMLPVLMRGTAVLRESAHGLFYLLLATGGCHYRHCGVLHRQKARKEKTRSACKSGQDSRGLYRRNGCFHRGNDACGCDRGTRL